MLETHSVHVCGQLRSNGRPAHPLLALKPKQEGNCVAHLVRQLRFHGRKYLQRASAVSRSTRALFSHAVSSKWFTTRCFCIVRPHPCNQLYLRMSANVPDQPVAALSMVQVRKHAKGQE